MKAVSKKKPKVRRLAVQLDFTLDELESQFDGARQMGAPHLLVFNHGGKISCTAAWRLDDSRSTGEQLFGLDTNESLTDQINRLGPKFKFR